MLGFITHLNQDKSSVKRRHLKEGVCSVSALEQTADEEDDVVFVFLERESVYRDCFNVNDPVLFLHFLSAVVS